MCNSTYIAAMTALLLLGAACDGSSSGDDGTNHDGNGSNSGNQNDAVSQTATLAQGAPLDDRQAPLDDRQAPLDDRQAPLDDRQAPPNDRRAPLDDQGPATPQPSADETGCASTCARAGSAGCVEMPICTQLCSLIELGLCPAEANALLKCVSKANTCDEYDACESKLNAFSDCAAMDSAGAVGT